MAALFIGAIWGVFFIGYIMGMFVFWGVTILATIYTCAKMFMALFGLLKKKK